MDSILICHIYTSICPLFGQEEKEVVETPWYLSRFYYHNYHDFPR